MLSGEGDGIGVGVGVGVLVGVGEGITGQVAPITTQSIIAKFGDLSPLYETYQIEHSPSLADVPDIRAVRSLSTVDPQDDPPLPGIVCHQLILMFCISLLKPLAMHSRLPELHEMFQGLVAAIAGPIESQGRTMTLESASGRRRFIGSLR